MFKLLMCLTFSLYAETFKCTSMLSNEEMIDINSTVNISPTKANVVIDGIGTFHYAYRMKSPDGFTMYDGTDNYGYIGYFKLQSDTIALSDTTAISGCVRVKR